MTARSFAGSNTWPFWPTARKWGARKHSALIFAKRTPVDIQYRTFLPAA